MLNGAGVTQLVEYLTRNDILDLKISVCYETLYRLCAASLKSNTLHFLHLPLYIFLQNVCIKLGCSYVGVA